MGEPDRQSMVRASIAEGNHAGAATLRRVDRLRKAVAPAAIRVWAFSLGLALIAILVDLTILERRTFVSLAPIVMPWPVIAAGFCLAELKVVDVHFRREAHSFSLSEFPAVLGPVPPVAARLPPGRPDRLGGRAGLVPPAAAEARLQPHELRPRGDRGPGRLPPPRVARGHARARPIGWPPSPRR